MVVRPSLAERIFSSLVFSKEEVESQRYPFLKSAVIKKVMWGAERLFAIDGGIEDYHQEKDQLQAD